MRTTLIIDDDLIECSRELTGIQNSPRAGRLAALGGTQPDIAGILRRCPQ